jgi:hypothetical protein
MLIVDLLKRLAIGFNVAEITECKLAALYRREKCCRRKLRERSTNCRWRFCCSYATAVALNTDILRNAENRNNAWRFG